MTSQPPALIRPTYDVWLADDADALTYLARVTIRNCDQLTAETQSKGLGIVRDQPFHLTNLWIWAALVREGLTAERFPALVKRMEYRPVDDSELEAVPDPTPTTEGVSTD